MKSINNTNRSYVTRNFSDFDVAENTTPIDEAAFDFLTSKGKLFGDVNQAATNAKSEFDSYSGDPDQQSIISDSKSKIDEITSKLGGNPKAHDRSKYREFLEEIEKIRLDFKEKQKNVRSKSEDYKKSIEQYREVAKITEEAFEMSKEARKKDINATIEISKKKAIEKNTKDVKLKDAIKLSKTLKRSETKGKNEEIHDIQKEFIRKFKNNSKIKDSEIYKKIKNAVEVKKEGGFFGPTTEKIIKGLKAGFGMDYESADITQDLINKIYTEKIEESNGFRSIKGFSNFDKMNEDFDSAKFLEVVEEKDKESANTKEIDNIVDKSEEESYNNNKEAFDYIIGKDFEPSSNKLEAFKRIFEIEWKEFKNLDDKKKKKSVASAFMKYFSKQKGLGKTKMDYYFKDGGQ